ncbi:MAG TPA: RNA methyltransferase [Terriglobia bacterium]|nr:RNA methyltransferase [Terriglobia bacterium]
MAQARTRPIRSPTNSLLKVYRRALAKGTTREGWLAVEGPFLVEEALGAAPAVRTHSVLMAESGWVKFARLLERLPAEAEAVQVPDCLFEQVAQTQNPQGIAALVELPPHSLDTVLRGQNLLLLVACGLQDPGNLGTLMRSSAAFGASAVCTLSETVSPFNPKAVRSSAGAVFHIPILADLAANHLLDRLRVTQVRLVATDRHSTSPLYEADLRGSLAILVGREASGLPPEITREASLRLSIPIRPGMDSINAATAGSVFLYEAARQRGFKY